MCTPRSTAAPAPVPSGTPARAWRRAGAVLYDPFLALGERRGMAARRRELLAGASGRVLEIGAGTGLNLPFYGPGVGELVLTDPDEAMLERLRRRAARVRPAARVLTAGAEALPFGDASFDVVVATMVFCTVADPAAAAAEVRRVLKPGGRLLYVEHVRAEAGSLAGWQDRLAGPWEVFAAGCRCDRHTLDALGAALELHPPRRDEWRGMPRIVRPLVLGTAVRPL